MMWELIQQNRRKSLWLFAGMAIALVLLGFFVAAAVFGEDAGVWGIVFALGLWLALTLISVNAGDDILLRVSGAREVTKDVHPRLFNIVEEMKIASQLPVMPRVFIIDQAAPNAFAIGIKPEKSAVAVTAGLLSRLNRDELQGVVAHEIGHILNRDSQLMTVAGIMLGSIVLLSQVFMRSWWFVGSGSSSRRYRQGGGGGSPQIQLVMVVVAVVLAILAPIFARLLYLAISRKREYLADATAARLTRYPEGLASALEKISTVDIPLETANQVTAPMYIASPLGKKGMKLSSLDSTHPPIEERIRILRGMTRGADLLNYQRSFSKVKGKPTMLIPSSGLRKNKHVPIRAPHPEPEKSQKKTVRDAMDLMRAMNGYAFIVCACGLKIKLPPNMARPGVECPRCGRENKLPMAELATVGAAVEATVGVGGGGDDASGGGEGPSAGARATEPELRYTRQGGGWETFACSCGRRLQLSPAFNGTHLTCKGCGRATRILG